jgi:predicted FMN-binding regulatory protein PaiB
MKLSKMFHPSDEEVTHLVANHPFGLLISNSVQGISATPLPLLLERNVDGTSTIIGHFALANPQVAQLLTNPDALIVFQGPHGYISPSWFDDRTQAPTWNFATVHFTVQIEFLNTQSDASEAVEKLSARMESGRPDAWSPAEMGDRYLRLLPAIIAFRAHVLSISAKFKLGQNERQLELEQSLAGLERNNQHALAMSMRAANLERLSPLHGASIRSRSSV